MSITAKTPLIATVSFVVGGAVGAFAAYKITERRLTVQFEEEMIEETSRIKIFYANRNRFDSPQAAVKALIPDEVIVEQDGTLREPTLLTAAAPRQEMKTPYHLMGKNIVKTTEEVVETLETVDAIKVQTNLFVQAEQNKNLIYPISVEDYLENETDFVQTELTYYAKDGVIVDERDDVVDDVIATIGQETMNKLSVCKTDGAEFHCRNDVLSLEFEITVDPRSYTEHVLGQTYEPPAPRPSGRE